MTIKHEFSAGGVVIRNGEVAVIVPRSRGGLALPKGWPEPGEDPTATALREVREETGITAEIVDTIGDIEYWFMRAGERIDKRVTFYLMRYCAGDTNQFDHNEVTAVHWLPLATAAEQLTHPGEREIMQRTMDKRKSHTTAN